MLKAFKKENLISIKFFPYFYSACLLIIWPMFEENVSWTTWRVLFLFSFIVSVLMHRNYLKLNKHFNQPDMELYKAHENILTSTTFSILIVLFIGLFFMCLTILYSFITWSIPHISYYSLTYIIPKLLLISWLLLSLFGLIAYNKLTKQ